ncbi:MAG: tetratricopeptide repeat protein, partial [Maribacter sp.]|uniref:tetratricopeptide repeat-containing sensor histidine kinase n=1 Tax=Maribacter sp. TaxID=1897614 RepID=UPI003C74136B
MPLKDLRVNNGGWSILICLIFNLGHAQFDELDSLRALIKKSNDDTIRINLYYEYGSRIETAFPDSAMWYYDMAKRRSVSLKFLKGVAAYASHAITHLNNKGEFRTALKISKDALKIYEELGNSKELAVAYLNVGSEWHYLSDFQQAAEYYLKAKKIADEISDRRLQRIINNNLASIFINLKDYEKGLRYAETSLAIAEELENDYAISSSMFNMATVALYLKEYDKALKYYVKIEEIGHRTNDFILILDGWLGSADVNNAMKNRQEALAYYNKVIDFSKGNETPEYEMYAYMGLSDLYMDTKKYAIAKLTIQKGIALAQKLGSKYELKDLYLKASSLEEASGQFKKALYYRKEFEMLNDSIVGEKSKTNIELLEAKYDSEKQALTIEKLESEKKIQELTIRQKNNLTYILVGTSAAILILSLLFYRNYVHRQKLQQQRIGVLEKEKQLDATEGALKGEEQERSRLAKDLHDGLGGMLSGIKYSLQLMKGNLVMTPENQQAFERSMDMLDSSINEMRRVAHNMMPESLIKFGLEAALKDFCNEISASGALQINYQSIGLSDLKIDQTTSITIYRI